MTTTLALSAGTSYLAMPEVTGYEMTTEVLISGPVHCESLRKDRGLWTLAPNVCDK